MTTRDEDMITRADDLEPIKVETTEKSLGPLLLLPAPVPPPLLRRRSPTSTRKEQIRRPINRRNAHSHPR